MRLRPEPSTSGRIRGLWWISPAGGVLFVVVPTLLMAALIPDVVYRQAWRTPKYLTSATVTTLLFAIVLFCLASLVPLIRAHRNPISKPWPGFSDTRRADLMRASGVLFWLTIFGYVAFAAAGLARGVTPALLLSAFTAQNNLSGDLKELFAPVVGITTLTQIGIAYVTVASLLLLQGRDARLLRRLLIVVGLATLRSFIVTERLAVLELIIPIAVVFAMGWAGDARAWVRSLVNWLAVLMMPVLLAIFAVFEYSRSWVFFRARYNGTFLDFAMQRFAGYYATAYNNGQVGMLYDNLPRRLPLFTLDSLWTAPGIEQLQLYDRLSPDSSDYLFTVLTQVANPEFNNYGGLSAPFVDWGLIGGLAWWTFAGLILGIAYRGFANGGGVSLLLYPALVTGVYEMPRYVYWAQGRLFPALLALLLVAYYASTAGRRFRARLRPVAQVPA